MKRALFKISIVLALALAITATAYASATFGTVTGPTYLNPGYRFTAQVIAMGGAHRYVCILPTVGGVPMTTTLCSCPVSDCNAYIGQWTCTISPTYTNIVIGWDISAYPNTGCGGTKAQGPTGTFTTGPTALTTMTLTAQGGALDRGPDIVLMLIFSVVIVATGWWTLRRRSAA